MQIRHISYYIHAQSHLDRCQAYFGRGWPVDIASGGPRFGSLIFKLLTLASGQSLSIPKSQWWALAIAGLFNVAGFNICAVFAQLSMPTSRAAIVTFTMPVWSSLLAWAWLGDRIDHIRGLSLIVGSTGLAVLSMPFWSTLQGGAVPFGLIFALGAAISWAVGTVYIKFRPIAGDPIAVTAWQIGVGATVCASGMAMLESPRIDLSQPVIVCALIYHVVFCQAIAYALWFGLVRRVSASTAALGTMLIPIFGVIGAILILGERPTSLDLGGFALVLAGVLLDQGYRTVRARGGTGYDPDS
jgi:drug/metabolite transporter (DMT)-like permease